MISNPRAIFRALNACQAAIFDLDGTLIDSEPIYAAGWRYGLAEQGYQISAETLKQMTGQSIQHNDAIIQGIVGEKATAQAVRLAREKYYYRALTRGEVTLLPGVREFLSYLVDRNIALALASASKKEKVVKTLRVLAIDRFFTIVVAGDEVQQSKPHPEIYLTTLAALQRPAQATIAFEDSLAGVQSSTRAHLKTVIVGDRAPVIQQQLSASPEIVGTVTTFSALLAQQNNK